MMSTGAGVTNAHTGLSWLFCFWVIQLSFTEAMTAPNSANQILGQHCRSSVLSISSALRILLFVNTWTAASSGFVIAQSKIGKPFNTLHSSLTEGISHVGLSVSNLEKSYEFFEALGFTKHGSSEAHPSIFINNGSIMVTLWQADGDAKPLERRNNVGFHHLTIRVPSLEALSKTYKIALTVDGVYPDFPPVAVEGTNTTHCMVFEPSGHRIEFVHQAA